VVTIAITALAASVVLTGYPHGDSPAIIPAMDKNRFSQLKNASRRWSRWVARLFAGRLQPRESRCGWRVPWRMMPTWIGSATWSRQPLHVHLHPDDHAALLKAHRRVVEAGRAPDRILARESDLHLMPAEVVLVPDDSVSRTP